MLERGRWGVLGMLDAPEWEADVSCPSLSPCISAKRSGSGRLWSNVQMLEVTYMIGGCEPSLRNYLARLTHGNACSLRPGAE